MQVEWFKCAGGAWCGLDQLDLTQFRANGVYVLWKPATSPFLPATVVTVGHGVLGTRLAAARADPAVLRYGPGLLVTWAAVEVLFSGGVAVYLNQRLRPLLGDRFPFASPIEVNLPITA